MRDLDHEAEILANIVCLLSLHTRDQSELRLRPVLYYLYPTCYPATCSSFQRLFQARFAKLSRKQATAEQKQSQLDHANKLAACFISCSLVRRLVASLTENKSLIESLLACSLVCWRRRKPMLVVKWVISRQQWFRANNVARFELLMF